MRDVCLGVACNPYGWRLVQELDKNTFRRRFAWGLQASPPEKGLAWGLHATPSGKGFAWGCMQTPVEGACTGATSNLLEKILTSLTLKTQMNSQANGKYYTRYV